MAVMPATAAAVQKPPRKSALLPSLAALFRAVWQASPGLTLASGALRLSRSLLPPAMLFVGKLILDEVVRQANTAPPGPDLTTWLASGRLNHCATLLGLELALALASDGLGRASSLVDGLLSELYANAASIRLMEHASTLDLAQFEGSDEQDQLERARRQVAGRSSLLTQIFGQVQDAVTALTLAAALAAYAPSLLALLAASLLPSFFNERHFNQKGYHLNYVRSPERRQLDYLRFLGASVDTAREVKLFGLHGFIIDRFRGFATAMYADNRRLAIRRAAWGVLFAGLSALAYYTAYAVIVWRTLQGQFSIGDLSFLAGSFLRLRGLLETLLLGFSQIAGQAQYLGDLFGFFEIRPAVVSPPEPLPLPDKIVRGFAFEGVGFRYPGAERWVVRDLDFELRAGEVIALVGGNGAGKTTVVKLLARLYDPSEGRITLDGIDLRAFDIDALRARIGVIFQDFVRFQFTAAENIGVGDIDARGDRPRVAHAASRALADLLIADLPGGYDQQLGRRFDDGVDLSGGEWQKIAIARAYMRAADVLILDEPTSALDARAEYEVFQRFKDLSAGKTAVLISHRFSTVRMADRIIVLEAGRVIENGTHGELLAGRGRYAELFELQAAGYR